MHPQALLELLAFSPPAHLGFIYDPQDPWRQVALSFAAQGLVQGERVTYFFTHGSRATLAEDLGHLGVDTAAARKKGQLTIMEAERFYLTGGRFDPHPLLERIEDSLGRALGQGYQRLRVVSEMDWAAGGQEADGLKLAGDYERLLNERIFTRFPLSALCVYDRRRFNPLWQDMVCRHHPHLLSQAGIIRHPPSLS